MKKIFITLVILSVCQIAKAVDVNSFDPNLYLQKIEQLEKTIKSQQSTIEKLKDELIYLRNLCSEAGIQITAKSQRKAIENKEQQQQDIPQTQPDIESVESPIILKVGDGELRVKFQFTTLYIPASPNWEARRGYSGFFFVTYQESDGTGYKKPIEGNFRVNGKATKLTIQSSNEKVIAGYGQRQTVEELLTAKKMSGSFPLCRELDYTDDYGVGLNAVGPGTANIIISLAGRRVSVPIKVVEIPINGGGYTATVKENPAHTKDDVIKILGLPDKREEHYMSWPDSGSVDGIFYSTHSNTYGVSIEHWKYDKYPGLVISFEGKNVEEVRTIQEFETPD